MVAYFIRCEWRGKVWTKTVNDTWGDDTVPHLWHAFRTEVGARRMMGYIPLRTGQKRWIQSAEMSAAEFDERCVAAQVACLQPPF